MNKTMILGIFQFKKATTLFTNKKYVTLLRDTVWHGTHESFWLVGTIKVIENGYVLFNPCHIYLCTFNSFDIHETLPRGPRLPISLNYYELDSQRQKIQSAMEERALQIILKNVVNDPYFEFNGFKKN
jgi:hypothetical protein